MTRKLRALTAMLAAATVLMAAFAAHAAALPSNFWGVVPQATPTSEHLQRLKRGGVKSTRIPIAWGAMQQAPGGPIDWSGVDTMVREAAATGIEVLPFVNGVPSWAVPVTFVDRRNGIKAPLSLPVRTGMQRAAWISFLKQAVLRYGPRGGFWAENPGLPKRPIRTWQIWNEPNFKYFVARPNPGEYGKLVKISYAAIRSVDPGAKIILAGLFARPIEATFKRKPPQAYFASDFLDQMYERTPGIKAKFHGVALHPYTGRYQRLTPYIEEVLTVLKANHDTGKGLWITELGWSSKPPTAGNSFAKGLGGQKAQLQGSFGVLLAKQRQWRVQRVYWFSVDDQPGSCNFCDGSGLFSEGFVPKPAWRAYVKFAGGRP